MANITNARKTFTNLSDPQQIRELNRQMEWVWHQLMGGLTEKAFNAGYTKHFVTTVQDTIAANIAADSASVEQLKAVLAQMIVAQIAVAQLDFAQVADLISEALILERAVGNDVLIKNLVVTNANMLNAVVGNLVLKGTDDNFYSVSVGSDGTISVEDITDDLTQEEIESEVTSTGKPIVIEQTINAETISGSTIRASEASLNSVLTAALTAGKITASDAMLASATIPLLYATSMRALGDSLDLSANQTVNIAIGTAVDEALGDVTDAIEVAQHAAETAQDTAEMAQASADEVGNLANSAMQLANSNSTVANNIRTWFEFSENGMAIRKTGSRWSTAVREDGFYIYNSSAVGYENNPVGRFFSDRLELKNLVFTYHNAQGVNTGSIITRASATGGIMWV